VTANAAAVVANSYHPKPPGKTQGHTGNETLNDMGTYPFAMATRTGKTLIVIALGLEHSIFAFTAATMAESRIFGTLGT
jgi:hypothetical protein